MAERSRDAPWMSSWRMTSASQRWGDPLLGMRSGDQEDPHHETGIVGTGIGTGIETGTPETGPETSGTGTGTVIMDPGQGVGSEIVPEIVMASAPGPGPDHRPLETMIVTVVAGSAIEASLRHITTVVTPLQAVGLDLTPHRDASITSFAGCSRSTPH